MKPTVEWKDEDEVDGQLIGPVRIVGDCAGAFVDLHSKNWLTKHQAQRLAARLDAEFLEV